MTDHEHNTLAAIVINAWLNIAGEEHTATWNLTAPRPAQPYPSWTWSGTAWMAPVAYPEGGGEYTWDEAGQQWVSRSGSPSGASPSLIW